MTSSNTPDMLEATRLAREGRLAEASALLQRLFRGGMKDQREAGRWNTVVAGGGHDARDA